MTYVALGPLLVVTPVHLTGKKVGLGVAASMTVVVAVAMNVMLLCFLNSVACPSMVTVTSHQASVLFTVSEYCGTATLPSRIARSGGGGGGFLPARSALPAGMATSGC